ncbi:MAG: formylglycine-generating enzyme family protein [Nitrospinaceae bacterium]
MNWPALTVFSLGLFLFSCESHEVEQIPVEVPAGVTVPEGMVYIPAGEFIMGHKDDPNTLGGRKVMTPAYLIDRYEVTRAQYKMFRPEYEYRSPKAQFPVPLVTYQEAEAFCRWKEKRLPKETEWEKAARGVDGRKWPWNRYFKHPNTGFSGFIPEAVDKRDEWISPYGVYGMGYNVWEWTSDWYNAPGQPAAERKRFKVIRGGLTQMHLSIQFTPAYFRNWIEPEASFNFLGFRCAKDIG